MADPTAEPNGKASIREVYSIVSTMETKIVAELRLSEDRITRAVEEVRRSRSSDMERIEALEAWRSGVESSKVVMEAVRDGRWWMVRSSGDFLEAHWRTLSLLVLLLIFVIGKVHIEF